MDKVKQLNLYRIVAIMLLLTMVFSIIPSLGYSAGYFTDYSHFKEYLISTYGKTTDANNKYEANWSIYQNYDHQIVYGSPSDVPGNESAYVSSTGRTEYRYLGYAYNGTTAVTNTYFRADPGTDGTNPTQWTFRDVNGAPQTWENITGDQRNHMKSATLSYNGIPYSDLTINSIGGTGKAQVLTTPSWKVGFSVYTQFKNTKNLLRYATLVGPAMASSTPQLNLSISTPQNTYTIPADSDSITLPVTVTAYASLTGPYVNVTQVKKITATQGDKTSTASGTYTTSVTANKVIKKADLGGSGTYTVPLNGSGTVDSIFGDSLAGNASKNITVVVAGADPYLEITASASPAEKKVSKGKSEHVTITGTATIKNYNNAANVKQWRWYAKEDGKTEFLSATLPGKTLSSNLTSSSNFKFTINASNWESVDKYLQNFKVTATADFETPIQGQNSTYSYVTASTNADSYFYIDSPPAPVEPPPPEYGPPVAKVRAQSPIEAGYSSVISATGSYSPNGSGEVTYMWGTPGASGSMDGARSKSLQYLRAGVYPVYLTVMDDMGLMADAETIVKVTPPYPIARMQIRGTLKENRMFTIDSSTSMGSAYYPLDKSKTTWSIRPLSGGTLSDVKYEGSLNEEERKEILIKKAGKYEVSLTVWNTAGMSDTKTQIIEIAPDLPPLASVHLAEKVMRDPANSCMATIKATDQGYSPDGDTINSRIWTLYYDSDNDGSFDDETAVKTINSGNNKEATFTVPEVGNYKVTLTIKESFGQPTIPAFINADDYLTAYSEATTECINNAPVASFALTEKQKVDLTVATDYTGSKLTNLTTELNALKTAAFANGVDLQFTINDGSKNKKVGVYAKPGRYYNGISEYITNTNMAAYYSHPDTPANLPKVSNLVTMGSTGASYIDSNGIIHAASSVSRGTSSSHIPLARSIWHTIDEYDNYSARELADLSISYPQYSFWDSNPYSLSITEPAKDVAYVGGRVAQMLILTQDGRILSYGNDMYAPFTVIGGSNTGQAYRGVKQSNVTDWSSNGQTCLAIVDNVYINGTYVDGVVRGFGNGGYHELMTSPREVYTYNSYYLNKYSKTLPGLPQGGMKRVFLRNNSCFAIDANDNVWAWGKNPNSPIDGSPLFGFAADCTSYQASDTDYNVPCNELPRIIPNFSGKGIKDISIQNNHALLILRTDGTVDQYAKGNTSKIDSFPYSQIWTYTKGKRVGNVVSLTTTETFEMKDIVALSGNQAVRADKQVIAMNRYSSGDYGQKFVITDLHDLVDPVYGIDLKSMEAALREGSDRYFLWISDGEGDDYSKGYGNYFGMGSLSSEFAKKIIEANYAITAVCPASTYDFDSGLETQDLTVRNFVNSSLATENPMNKLYDKGEYALALAALKAKYTQPADKILEKYVIAGEDILEYKTYYDDYERDPLKNSSWHFDHNPTYFENDTGTAWFSGSNMTAPVSSFIQPGKYHVTYRVQDNPKDNIRFDEYKLWSEPAEMDIYAHRRPIASFSIGFTGRSGNTYYSTVSNNSYDLDHLSKENKGIVSSTWRWKNIESPAWSTGSLPTSWTGGETYMISLVVTDMEGAESYPYVEIITADPNHLMPTIDCTPQHSPWANKDLTVTITATDATPDLTSIRYAITDSMEQPTSWTSLTSTDPSSFSHNVSITATGIYYLHMKALDAKGHEFYRVRGPYNIDKLPPSIDCSPKSGDMVAESIDITISASDTGGSGLNTIYYKFSETADKPGSGWSSYKAQNTKSDSLIVKLSKDGTYYLHMIATDKAGNSSYQHRGPFTKTSLEITDLTISGYWNHWRGQIDIFGKQMTNEPHRFLSYEKVKITVKTKGNPDRLEFSFSPELESMSYTDVQGNVYKYSEKTGYNVSFPHVINSPGETVVWEYILPLATSTKGWDDKILKEPYWLQVKAIKDGKDVSRRVSDINITGNVYNLTYIQPLK
jgi:hypothetical protein